MTDGPKVLWWADLRRIGGPVYDWLRLADADPSPPPRDPVQEAMATKGQRLVAELDAFMLTEALGTTQNPSTTAAPDSCLTLERLDALVEEVQANAPPPCRLIVNCMLEARRLADSMGFEPDRQVYQGVLHPVESFLGIPINATKGCPPGTAIFIVESNPPRAYVVEVPD